MPADAGDGVVEEHAEADVGQDGAMRVGLDAALGRRVGAEEADEVGGVAAAHDGRAADHADRNRGEGGDSRPGDCSRRIIATTANAMPISTPSAVESAPAIAIPRTPDTAASQTVGRR